VISLKIFFLTGTGNEVKGIPETITSAFSPARCSSTLSAEPLMIRNRGSSNLPGERRNQFRIDLEREETGVAVQPLQDLLCIDPRTRAELDDQPGLLQVCHV
jgi:hypothetical protein